MTTARETFDLRTAPIHVRTVRLKVRDLDTVFEFYERVLGLRRIAARDGIVTLGTGEMPLLELSGDPGLAPGDPRQAGLFHTAFLMPSRPDLARWLAYIVEARVPLQGASDHTVSEAIYLADPEGNGVEVYADRPVSRWRTPKGKIHMTTERLDVQGLLSAASGTSWSGFPEEGAIGHVHLQVGDIKDAEAFYRDILGFEVTCHYPGASFFGSGGYHHQLAGNIWNSRRAGPRPKAMAGLDGLELVVREAAERDAIAERAERAGISVEREADGPTLRDPWGAAISLTN